MQKWFPCQKPARTRQIQLSTDHYHFSFVQTSGKAWWAHLPKRLFGNYPILHSIYTSAQAPLQYHFSMTYAFSAKLRSSSKISGAAIAQDRAMWNNVSFLWCIQLHICVCVHVYVCFICVWWVCVCVCVRTDCPVGRYGIDCSRTCPCTADTACDRQSGQCQCQPGFMGPACNISKCLTNATSVSVWLMQHQ